MEDPRIAPVEDNLLSFAERLAESPVVRRDPHPDVLALHSDVAFPPFNSVSGARFGRQAAARAQDVAGPYLEAGLPWMWWLTPSTTSPELEATLSDLGLVRDPVPGMYRDLDAAVHAAPPDGVEVSTTDDADLFVGLAVAGFELPDWVAAPMTTVVRDFPGAINVVATVDGAPAACGTAYLTGATAGLYNIASLPEARGRGAGYAVTAGLLDVALEAGCTHAILHSSEAGFALYRRLGFVEVCQTPQYVWSPPE